MIHAHQQTLRNKFDVILHGCSASLVYNSQFPELLEYSSTCIICAVSCRRDVELVLEDRAQAVRLDVFR
jgi:hypothetical protein